MTPHFPSRTIALERVAKLMYVLHDAIADVDLDLGGLSEPWGEDGTPHLPPELDDIRAFLEELSGLLYAHTWRHEAVARAAEAYEEWRTAWLLGAV
jgi:hypothetical protein